VGNIIVTIFVYLAPIEVEDENKQPRAPKCSQSSPDLPITTLPVVAKSPRQIVVNTQKMSSKSMILTKKPQDLKALNDCNIDISSSDILALSSDDDNDVVTSSTTTATTNNKKRISRRSSIGTKPKNRPTARLVVKSTAAGKKLSTTTKKNVVPDSDPAEGWKIDLP